MSEHATGFCPSNSAELAARYGTSKTLAGAGDAQLVGIGGAGPGAAGLAPVALVLGTAAFAGLGLLLEHGHRHRRSVADRARVPSLRTRALSEAQMIGLGTAPPVPRRRR